MSYFEKEKTHTDLYIESLEYKLEEVTDQRDTVLEAYQKQRKEDNKFWNLFTSIPKESIGRLLITAAKFCDEKYGYGGISTGYKAKLTRFATFHIAEGRIPDQRVNGSNSTLKAPATYWEAIEEASQSKLSSIKMLEFKGK